MWRQNNRPVADVHVLRKSGMEGEHKFLTIFYEFVSDLNSFYFDEMEFV